MKPPKDFRFAPVLGKRKIHNHESSSIVPVEGLGGALTLNMKSLSQDFDL